VVGSDSCNYISVRNWKLQTVKPNLLKTLGNDLEVEEGRLALFSMGMCLKKAELISQPFMESFQKGTWSQFEGVLRNWHIHSYSSY
jgi:hypothetical protein